MTAGGRGDRMERQTSVRLMRPKGAIALAEYLAQLLHKVPTGSPSPPPPPPAGESKPCLTSDPTSATLSLQARNETDPFQYWVINVSPHEFYTSTLELAQKIAQEDATLIPKLESDKKMDAAAAGGDNGAAENASAPPKRRG
ncbi:hypothetical protein B0H14DRAFT_2641785 [Mycena olivaceomarginata]|nr:hypothetical protein B0H14DRAFT_2641785 [Mycena olivaceomarginata]